MAEQKIKVKVSAEWANINELMAELDTALATRKTKTGKPIPKSKETIAKEADVRSKHEVMGRKIAAGVRPADMAQDFNDFFLSFKELVLSLLTATQSAKDEVSKLNHEVHALQTTKTLKEQELTRTLKQGVLQESGILEPTKKARQDAMRELAIPNRSGGRGEFYTTQDVTKLDRIMNEFLARADKIGSDTPEAKTQSDELKSDAARIQDAIKMLNSFQSNLNTNYQKLTVEIKALTDSIKAKKDEAFVKYENLPTPETDLDTQGLGSSAYSTELEINKEISESEEKKREEYQKTNKVREDSIETDEKQRGSIGKLLTSFFGYQMALRALRKLWNDAIQTIQKLDAALTEQAIVSSLNRKEAWDLVKSYQALAKATGFTTTAIAEVATQYFRQGKTTREVMILTEAAAKSAKVASIDAKQAVDYLTTALNGFQLAAEKAIAVSDKFAALAATSATSYEELAISLSKVAAQANLAGMSINYTLGLLAKGIETTREPAESIGTALKTIVARMRELTDYGATLEDGMNLNNVEKQLAYINIQLRGQDGQLRSTEEVLDELGKRWDTLTINQQASIAKALAGTRQQARLIAMMSDYERTLELVRVAEDSAGATQAQQVEYMESLEASQKRLATAYEALITALVNNDAVKTIINFIAQVIERFAAALSSGDKSATSITRQIGTWVSVLGVIVAMLVPLLVKTVNNVREIFSALKNTKAIEAEKLRLLTQQNLQRQYSLQLLQQEYLLGKQNAGTLTPKEKKQLANISGQVAQTKKDLDASDTIKGASGTAEGMRLEKQRAGALKAQGVMMVIAGAAAAVSFIADAVKRIQNAAADAAAQTIEKNTKLQAEIYENTQIINSITKLTDSFETLDDKLVKTSKDWEEIENIRQQLLEQFKEEERQSMENMRIEELLVNADRRKTELEAKNIEKLSEMEENMKKASGTVDWLGNIGAAAGAGAMIGGGIGMMMDAGTAGATMGAGTLGGALIGGAIGMWTGIATSIAEKVEKSNAEKAIKEMLKTEEGLAQARYLYSQQLKNVITETGIQADKIRSLYEGLLQTLDADELEEILLKSGMTAQEYAKHMAEIMKQNYTDISALTDSSTSYSDKIEALNNLLDSNMPEEMKDGLRAMYGELLDLTKYFPTSIKYLDTFGWSLGQINDFLLVMKNQGLNPDEWMNTIGTILNGTGTAQDKLGALGGAMKGLSATAMSAIADLVLAGLTLQNVTETQTQTASQVKGIRDTQGKWGDMTALERSSFISENMGLFQTDGKWDETKFQRFIQGMDITDMLDEYMLEERDRVLENYDTLLIGLGLQLQAKQQELREASTEEDRAAIQEIINNLEGEIKATEYLAEEALNIFDMTLDEMIKKQQQQISLYRDMLEAERDALIESLEERKDAYNDYFDAINKQYETQDYEEQKAKLEAQILKLSGATDAASMMKVAELQSQLADLEKGRADTLRQDAQTAVLESIDTQIDDANEYYDKRLENDAAMLAEMGNQLEVNKAAYELQYWNYLQTLGLSEEAKQQRFQEFQTTFSGGVTGSGTPYIPTFSTPNPNSVTVPETQNNYSFNINGRNVDFTKAETTALNELLRTALKRVGINLGI